MKMAAKMENMAMDANNKHERFSGRGQKVSGNGHPAGQAQGVCSVDRRYQNEHFSVFLADKMALRPRPLLPASHTMRTTPLKSSLDLFVPFQQVHL